MQTHFTDDQLADAATGASAAELRRCVHCGFCNARCPTYQLTGDELDSPRGRIYLIKEMLERDEPPSDRVVYHLDRCLSCLSCKTTCPSGVDYMQLIDHARSHIARRYRRPLPDRLMRAAVMHIFPRPRLFRAVAAIGRPAAALAPLLPGTFAYRARMTAFRHRRRLDAPAPSEPAAGAPSVLVLEGCVQPALGPSINTATRHVARRLGFRAVPVRDSECCGAIELHLGAEEAARRRVRRNVDSWIAALDETGAEHVVVNASGCGTMLKHYAALLADDPAYAAPAARLAAATRDVSEWLAEVLERRPLAPADAPRVAYHGACSLQHGQRIHGQVVTWLQDLGFDVVEPAEPHLCCGSAGTYNLFQPAMAQRLGERKAGHLAATGAGLVVAGNLGCSLQIGAYSDLPIVHPVELVDWALARSARAR